MQDELEKYIRQNRGRYTRRAINKGLLEAGYTREEIEAAWEQVELGDEAYRGASERGAITNRGAFVLALIGVVVVTYGLVLLWTNFVPGSNTSIVIIMLVAGAILVSLLAGGSMLNTNRSVGLGLIYGAVIVIALPVVLLFVLLGACLTGVIRL